MKKLLLMLCLLCLYSVSSATAAPPKEEDTITIGKTFSSATKVLATVGLFAEKREYDEIIVDGFEVRYFTINRNTAIKFVYTKVNDKITHMFISTTPSYRPVKGLEVDVPVRTLTFFADGSYAAQFAPIKKRDNEPHSK